MAVVCHGDFINCFLRCATGGLTLEGIAEQERAIRVGGGAAAAHDGADAVDLPLEQSLQFSSGNCSFSVVDFIPADDSVRVVERRAAPARKHATARTRPLTPNPRPPPAARRPPPPCAAASCA